MKLATATKTFALRGVRAIGARLSPARPAVVAAVVILSATASGLVAEGGSGGESDHAASLSPGEKKPSREGPLAPSPEMTRLLDVLDGTWDMAITYAPSATAPDGGTGKGQETSRPGPGGHSLLIETSSRGPSGPYQAGGIIEWSPGERVYKLHWVNSLSQVGSYFDGTWVGDNLVFNGTEYLLGKTLASRHSVTNIRPDEFLYTIDMGPTHDQLERTITIEYTRQRDGNK